MGNLISLAVIMLVGVITASIAVNIVHNSLSNLTSALTDHLGSVALISESQ